MKIIKNLKRGPFDNVDLFGNSNKERKMIEDFKSIKVQIGEKLYRFICDADSPVGEAHDALMQMKGIVIKLINDIHAAQEPKKEEPVACDKEETCP